MEREIEGWKEKDPIPEKKIITYKRKKIFFLIPTATARQSISKTRNKEYIEKGKGS